MINMIGETFIDGQNVLEVLEISDHFGEETLKFQCEEYLSNNLTTENVFGILVMSDKFSARLLYKCALSFILDTFGKEFFEMHPNLLKLLRKGENQNIASNNENSDENDGGDSNGGEHEEEE